MKLLGHGYYWQDLKVGDRYKTYGRTIADHDITAFCNVVGFVEPLFTDAEYRKSHSALPGFADAAEPTVGGSAAKTNVKPADKPAVPEKKKPAAGF